MQIVIDIPESRYELLRQAAECGMGGWLDQIVASGTSLPKGHGRLIDADNYKKAMQKGCELNFMNVLDMQPTIIEANTEDAENEVSD